MPKKANPHPREGEEDFVIRNTRLARSIVSWFCDVNKSLDRQALLSDAMYGLFMAARRFDPGLGLSETTYAVPYIKGYVLKGITKNKKSCLHKRLTGEGDDPIQTREHDPLDNVLEIELLDLLKKKLTNKEWDLLDLLSKGFNTYEIARIQGRSHQAIHQAQMRMQSHVRIRLPILLESGMG